MKKLLLLIGLLVPAFMYAQHRLELPSKIEKATVFYNGAQVTRVAKTQLQSGTSELTLKGITKLADVGNLQVKGEGNFTILKITPIPNYLREKDSKSELETLRKRNTEIARKQDDLAADKNVLVAERNLLIANQNIKGNTAVLTVVQLKDMADFFRNRLIEVEGKILDLDREAAKLDEEKLKNDAQMNSLGNYKNDMTYDIVVTVQAKAATTATVLVSYNTTEANWFASYDLKVNNVVEPVTLNMRANVIQSSGEEWKDVKLTLSTGSPTINNNKPEITPWFLEFNKVNILVTQNNPTPELTEADGFIYNSITGDPMPGASIMIKGTGIGTTTDNEGYFKLSLPQNSNMLVIKGNGYETLELWPAFDMEVDMVPRDKVYETIKVPTYRNRRKTKGARYNIREVVGRRDVRSTTGWNYQKVEKKADDNVASTIVVQPTNYNFEIQEPYTISSNGKANGVGIKEYNLPAYYEYYAAPKVDKDAFLTANLTSWQNYELVDGEVNIYYENTFVGKSLFNITNANDTLQVSLGRDKNVQVDLVKTKEYTQRQLLGSHRIDKRAWDIVVKNRKQQAINLVLEDRFPVSQTNEIEVDNTDVSDASFNKDTGILSWKMTLATGEERKVSPKYSVKYPKDKIVYLE
jgi:hypothetical protein